MEKTAQLKRRLAELFNSQKLAVLSTHNAGQPYASLVAFATTQDLRHLLFATTRSTRKYANIKSDARVAMLMDNRSNRDSDISNAIAVTATGTTNEIDNKNRDPFLNTYLTKHPHLKDFVNSPSCALIRMKVDTYYLVSKFQIVFELHVAE
jgi:general stress protein 26